MSYIQHIEQNWTNEPYIKGTYLRNHENTENVIALGKSVNNKLYFAGEAYTDGSDWGSVHSATRAAKRVVEELVK